MATGIRRRQFVSALGGAAGVGPLSARAEPSGGAARIGCLYPGVAAAFSTRVDALRQGLHAIGYGKADQVEILVHASEGKPALLAPLAADLVERRMDVIVAVSPSAVRA